MGTETVVGRNQEQLTSLLIYTIHWPHTPCSAPSWFDRDDNKPPVKGDLAIYSHVFDVTR